MGEYKLGLQKNLEKLHLIKEALDKEQETLRKKGVIRTAHSFRKMLKLRRSRFFRKSGLRPAT